MAGNSLSYTCSYCFEDISSVRVKCTECSDFDLCLQCFACGAEIGKHKSKHKYFLMDCGNFPLFQIPNSKWSAKEELLLLSSIEEHGYGNWDEVAQSIGDDFTAEDVQEHYNTMYVLGNIGEVTWKMNEPALTVEDHTGIDNGPLSPSPPVEISLQEQQELGYMPLREDFEKEYDNDAETVLVSNLVFSPDDDDLDKALKLAQIDMYTKKLCERVYRKKISRDHSLVIQFFNSTNKPKSQLSKKKMLKEENNTLREFQDRMQTFSRFYTQAEQDHLLDNLNRGKELKHKIKELVKLRKNGITKFEEVADAELNKCKTEKKENKKKPVTNTSRKKSSIASKNRDEKGNTNSKDESGADDNKKKLKQLKLSALREYKLLSVQEKKLCSSLKLKPSYYITFKTTLLKADLRKKQGKAVKSRYPSGLEKADCLKIVNFMVNSGWITSSSL